MQQPIWMGMVILTTTLIASSVWSAPTQRYVSVTGIGKVSAPPDMATVRTGVVSEANDAKQALSENNRLVQKLMSVLAEAGIAEKDIQTSNFNVRPTYERPRQDRGQRSSPKIVGYHVSNQLTVRVRKLDKLGDILDALVTAGSNDVSGISFGIADTGELMNQARRAAMEDARERAELYAESADVQVGQVLTISEQGSEAPAPRQMRRAMVMEAADAVPIAAGEQDLTVSVHVSYQLDGKP